MIRFSNFHYNREPSYFFIFLSQMYYTLTYFKICDKIRLSTSICGIKLAVYNILINYSFKLYQFIYIKNWSIYVKIGMIDHIDYKKGHQP